MYKPNSIAVFNIIGCFWVSVWTKVFATGQLGVVSCISSLIKYYVHQMRLDINSSAGDVRPCIFPDNQDTSDLVFWFGILLVSKR